MAKHPYKPQLPRPSELKSVAKWSDISQANGQLQTGDRNLRQYLQNYLTQIFNWVIPAKFTVAIISAAQSPYQVSSTDNFIAMASGQVNLPASSGGGRVLIVKKTDATANPVAITPQGTDTIDGGGVVNITLQYDAVRVIDSAIGQWLIW